MNMSCDCLGLLEEILDLTNHYIIEQDSLLEASSNDEGLLPKFPVAGRGLAACDIADETTFAIQEYMERWNLNSKEARQSTGKEACQESEGSPRTPTSNP